MGLLGFTFNREYNTYMLAYDVPLSALLFVIWAGVPAEYTDEPTEEEILAYIQMLKNIIENENDGL
jgi:hypothetical protein